MKKTLTIIVISSLLGLVTSPATADGGREIHSAVKAGDVGRVRQLLDQSPDLLKVTSRSGGTLLHSAVLARKPSSVATSRQFCAAICVKRPSHGVYASDVLKRRGSIYL